MTIAIIFNATTLFALNVDMKMLINKTEVKAYDEEEITVDLMLTNFEKISKGVYTYKAELDYDKDVFEKIDASDFVTKNSWTSLQYNEKNNQFVLIKKTGTRQEEEFLQVKLKVKKDSRSGNVNITVKNQIVSDGKEDILLQDSRVNVKVIQIDGNENSETGNQETNNDQNNQSNYGQNSETGNQETNNDQNNQSNYGQNLETGNQETNNDQNNQSNYGQNSETGNQETNNDQNNQSNYGQNLETGNQETNNNQNDQSNHGQNLEIENLKTGEKGLGIIIWIVLGASSIIIVWFRFKNKNINLKYKKIIGIIILVLATALITKSIHVAFADFSKKGELNDDGAVDYIDVELMEMHLINLKSLTEEKLDNADINNDGEITVTDLVLLIQKIEKTLDFEVTISQSQLENYYPSKNQELELRFYASVNYGAIVRKVVIDGQEYEAIKVGDSNEYKVKVNVKNTSGVQEFKFTKVILDNEKELNVNYTETVDVLKDKPIIENYRMEEDIKNNKVNISFDLKDDDCAFKRGYYQIVDENVSVVKENTIQTGKNKIELDFEEGKNYLINIYGGYDLDTNQLNSTTGEQNNVANENLLTKQIQIEVDYDLKITDLQVVNNDGVYSQDEPIDIMFKLTNAADIELEKVVINGHEYTVTKSEGYYKVRIRPEENEGKKGYKIEKVILANGKELNPDTEENKENLEVEVIKNKPEIVDFKVKEDVEKQKLKVNFKVKDGDNTFEKGIIILEDSSNREIARQEFDARENDIEFTTKDTDKYFIKILADYNLEPDGIGHEIHKYKEQEIFKKEIEAAYNVKVSSSTIDNYYPEKEDKVTINYEFTSNKEINVSKLQVNSVIYNVIKNSHGKYEVKVRIPNKAGIFELQLEKIILDDSTEIIQNHVEKVDILKVKPSVENYTMQDDLGNKKVISNFVLKDEEDSFIRGKAQLIDGEERVLSEHEIQKGQNKIELSVEENQLYKLKVFATYDKDTNQLENKNETDNRITDEFLFEQEILLNGDYGLQITDLNTYKGDAESKYFDKNENIKISFKSMNKTTYTPTKVMINGNTYSISKDGESYTVELNGYNQSGIQNIEIQKIELSNGKELDVTENNQVQIDILKDKPSVEEYKYKETTNGKYEITFKLVDNDKTLLNNKKVVVTDQDNAELVNQDITIGDNKISFDKTASEKYFIKVVLDYDLDSQTIPGIANEYKNQEILSEEIDSSARMIEMKDITSIDVFKQNGSTVEEVKRIDLSQELNLNDYLVKVNMKDLPSFYAPIKGYREDGNLLKFVLEYDKIVQYEDNEKQNKLEVTYGEIKNNTAIRNDFRDLLEQIKANPSGTYELTSDIDVRELDSSSVLFIEEFRGTLNGNGHTIKNLDRPLFNSLNGAIVKDIIIQDVKLSGSTSRGAIANEASKSTITNVHLRGLTMQTGVNESGSLIGVLKENSVIEKCSATDIKISGGNTRTGGLVGAIGRDGSVNNSYVQGVLNCKQDTIGGISGHAEGNSKVENNIAKVEFKVTSGPEKNGGIIGNLDRVTLKNNVSLSTGSKGNKVHGTKLNNASSNNYELKESTLEPNLSSGGVIEVGENNINENFYKEKVKLDESIWNLENTSYNKMPSLKNSDPNSPANKQDKPSNEKIYIPNYKRLKSLSNYDSKKEIAYNNMYKLMPFYDSNYLVIDGNKIDDNDILNTKLIKAVIPISEQDKAILGLTNNTEQDIRKLKILFEDDTIKEYTVKYKDTINNIANYEISDIKVGYNYNKYLLREESEVFVNLVNKIKEFTFNNNLNQITSEDESRIYKENFDNVVKNDAENFVIRLLTNMPEYNVSINNSTLESKVLSDLTNNNQLEKLLVAYNYFDRFYNIEIGGVTIRDFVFFDDVILQRGISPKIMTNLYLNASQDHRKTSKTVDFYNNHLKGYTGKEDLGTFIEYFISNFAGYKDPTRWFVDNFSGIIYEAPAQDYGEKIEYRAWNLMKRRPLLILPVLTAPTEKMYILSVPTSILLGSLNLYSTDPMNPEERNKLNVKIQEYGDQLTRFYNTPAGFIKDSETLMNKTASIHWDRRVINGVIEEPGITEEPVIKHIYEVTGHCPAKNGSGAYANGTDVYWVGRSNIGTIGTFTHETAHNQAGPIFFEGYGYRPNAGGECFTDSVIAQRFPDNSMHYNLMFDFDYTDEVSNNLTPERIDTKEELEDYYKKMWETINMLDYIEAQAFLQMSPEVQSKVAKQFYVPRADQSYKNKEQPSAWRMLSAEEFRKMNLKTMEDLWDNQINIKVKQNMNNGDSMDNVYWYQPHNDEGNVHFIMLKRLTYEMLSVGGYTDGMISYISAKYKNDLEALKGITKDPEMTWKKYQMNKYDEVAKKVESNSYFNVKELIDMFKQTMEADAKIDVDYNVPPDKEEYKPSDTANNNEGTKTTDLRRILYHYLQRATGDFKKGIYEGKDITHISDGHQFVQKIKENPHGKFILDADINLTGMNGTSSITDVDFVGEINGNNHTIKGMSMPIFNMVKYSNIYNLKLDDVNIVSTENEIGALSKTMSYSLLKNVHVVKGNISGASSVGGISGYVNKSHIEQSTSNINIQATGNSVGAFIGQLDNSMVKDSYSLGKCSGRQDMGGFVGYAENTSIENCFSSTKVESSTNGSGGFIGQSTVGNNIVKVRVANSVSLGNTVNAYKFDGRSNAERFKKYENNYEYQESIGSSTLDRSGVDFTGKISVVTTEELNKQEFYTKKLGWSSDIWDFSNVEKGNLPKLKNLDSNNATAMAQKNEISKIEDLKKINEAPDQIYILKNDIDVNEITEGDTIITANFTGRLEGNGYTIKNLNKPLFKSLNSAVIRDLKIENATLNGKNSRGALANEATNSKITNVHLKNLTMKTSSNESGSLIGTLKGGSTLEQSSAINVAISGGHIRTGGLVGAIGNGRVNNSYVEGTLNCSKDAIGGIAGYSEGNSKIENSIAKMKFEVSSDPNKIGGIIGKAGGVILNNNVSLSDGLKGYRVHGIRINQASSNNYELKDSTLTTNLSGNIVIEIEKDNINKDFFKNQVKLDEEKWDLENSSYDNPPLPKGSK